MDMNTQDYPATRKKREKSKTGTKKKRNVLLLAVIQTYTHYEHVTCMDLLA
jgi:hypothetical protein